MRQIGNVKAGEFVRDEFGTTWQINCHYTNHALNRKYTTLIEVGEKARKIQPTESTTKMKYLGKLCNVNGTLYTIKKRNPFKEYYL